MQALAGWFKREDSAGLILREYGRSSLPYPVIVPSARFGLYALARILMRPGEAVAISPITCRTVIESFLRAGVRPFFLDVDADTGNLDVACLESRRLETVRAVVTTNLYGNPDRVLEIQRIARARGWLLWEDCAHVVRSAIGGKWIGTVGDAAVFSFRKYFGVEGGVVATADARVASELEALVATQCTHPSMTREVGRGTQYWINLHAPEALARMAGRCGRWLFREGAPRPARCRAEDGTGNLDPRFCVLPDRVSLLRAAVCLRMLPRLVEERTHQARTLRERCGLRIGVNRAADRTTYFALPFLTPDRDLGLRRLAAAGIQTNFIYPPLHSLFPREAAGMPLDVGGVTRWSRRVLPVRLGYKPELESKLIACLEGLVSDQPSSDLAPVRDYSIC